ncbi:long-chain fatty acid transport protein 4-like [Teleopsis dalmanni]|uniref:long-chain fatty acid transport protein 4-like n=1 Tax=Teleopsis dalmanni TaxID=139649 RepID=UPI0018CDA55F|nr:long-chain fatty acid transport protein 4-like [Teleopsis dalmanni]
MDNPQFVIDDIAHPTFQKPDEDVTSNAHTTVDIDGVQNTAVDIDKIENKINTSNNQNECLTYNSAETPIQFNHTKQFQDTNNYTAICYNNNLNNIYHDQHQHQQHQQHQQQQQQQHQQQQRLKPKTSSEEKTVAHQVLLAAVYIGLVSGICVFLWFYMAWMIVPAILIALVVVLLTKPGWRWFYIAAVTSNRDLTGLWAYVKLLILIKRYEKKNLTISDIFQKHVAKHPDKIAILSDSQAWTFRQLNEFSNQIANVFHNDGYKVGDVVGLLCENRAEFVGTWLGLSKIGIITPLINTNQRGASLLHSINVAHCSALIYSEAHQEAIQSIQKDISSSTSLYQLNDKPNNTVISSAKNLSNLLQTVVKDKIISTDRANHHDKLVYIYTSGTTGLPKAAVISHSRYLFIAAGIHYTLGFKDDDTFYTPLPLYHTAGGVMSMGQAMIFGSTVAIRKKFSASGYFSDCVKFNCTVAQYIGEMARYILASPTTINDRKHKVRLIFGNGLRPQIWPQFVERFNIAKVGEFYGATEGNANIMNNDNTVGAIGFISRILPRIYPISILRADQDTGEPIRGPDGLCQLCEPNEPGVFIGKIIKGNPSREFLGYVDSSASAKKIIHDVFRKGDRAFLSGDLLIADERGYLFFKDRTGDTFRWKGENVSTSEVEAQVSNVAGYKDTIVYGVSVPNTEGRAGMAAIYDPELEIDLEMFSKNLVTVLPAYARPQFLRFLTKIDLTGTFKLRKVDLQKDGFDPNVISDKLYYYDSSKGKYEVLNLDVYNKILSNNIRF